MPAGAMKPSEEGKITAYSIIWCSVALGGLIHILVEKIYANTWEFLVGASIAMTLVSLSIFTDLFVPRGERFFWNVILASFLAMFMLFLTSSETYPVFEPHFLFEPYFK
ncbi:MAG: hypothetical protein AAF492_00515 [Verrucomicrobiota bacterium]